MLTCQTPVVNSTPASSIEPKPVKNTIEPTTAMAKERSRSISGSISGLGWRPERHRIAGSRTAHTT